ncbi:BTAD domain-containing putative transcriptional regulator [Amycolatopsis sp. cmx-11-12]|uniref:AfsR/SARP family transcriptional regulator n=1 Tax=Amycolatopsis sp. cmx-11-12 TaxID=2785795 RepID=UPI0039184DCD
MVRELEFAILGPLSVKHGNHPIKISSPKLRVLLSSLLLMPNRPVTISQLTSRLWGDDPPECPRRAVQLYVTRLRAVLGPSRELLTTVPSGYQLTIAPDQLDLLDYEELVAAAANSRDDSERARLLSAALELWRGDPCEDVAFDNSPPADLRRLTESRLQAEEDYVDAKLRLGEYGDLVGRLRRLTTDAPLRERFWVQLIGVLHSLGRQAEALATYAAIASRLADELGVHPGEELRAAHTRVLADDIDPVVPNGRSVSASPVVPRQVPPGTAKFTGRDAYLAQLDKSASPMDRGTPTLRLVTVDGDQGVGKTALAVHWAHLRDHLFPDGQLFVNLRSTPGPAPTDAEEALGTMLRSLGRSDSEIPDELDERAALFRTITAGRRMLVLLDDAEAFSQVVPLLPGPGNSVIITSRRKLAEVAVAYGGERIAMDVLMPAEALELFGKFVGAERVATERADAASIVGSCGYLPLSLAAVAECISDVATMSQFAQRLLA